MKSERIIFFIILLCCVVNIQVAAKPVQEVEMEKLTETTKIREENEVYGSQMNRSNNMWPRTERGIVFSLPRQLEVGDEISVTSVFLNNPQWMSLSLTEDTGSNEPDKNNIAGHIELNISQDTIMLKTVVNGISQSIEPDNPVANKPSNIVIEDNAPVSSFSINIRIERNDSTNTLKMGFEIGYSVIKAIELQHDISRIKYLTLDGDVEKVSNLQFNFA